MNVYNNKQRLVLLLLLILLLYIRLLPIIPNNTGMALLANLPVRLNRLAAVAADFQNEWIRQHTHARLRARRRSVQRFSNQPATERDGCVQCMLSCVSYHIVCP